MTPDPLTLTPLTLDPLPWPPADAGFAGLLVLMAALFALYTYRFAPGVMARRAAPDDEGGAQAIFRSRLIGAVLLGVVPATLALLGPQIELGLGLPSPGRAALGCAVILALALPGVIGASRQADFTAHYPPIRSARWPPRRVALNGATWTIYLVGYELFFRGVLLFGLAARMDPWLAIALTTAIYVLAHLPKPGKETAGTVPMGIVFAAVTLWSGSIWAAVLGHVIIANTSDLLAARRLMREPGALREPGPLAGVETAPADGTANTR